MIGARGWSSGSTVGSSIDPTTKINKEVPSTRRETRRSTGLDHSSGFWGRGSGRSRVPTLQPAWAMVGAATVMATAPSNVAHRRLGLSWAPEPTLEPRLGSGEHRRLRTLARPCGGIDWELVEATGLSREQIAENEVASR
jgi:hypothetical protein